MSRFSTIVLLVSLFACGAAHAQSTYTVAYTYDAQGRLLEADYGGEMAITYTYDANGNLLSRVTESPHGLADEEGTELPARFAVLGNFPNPFNPVTTVSFDLPESANVRVEVFDLLGRAVLVAPAVDVTAGVARTVSVDASPLASGMYFYRLVARSETRTMVDTGRMVLLK